MSQYLSDLQSLAQQWGAKFSEHYGTTCEWIDLHAANSAMAKYQQYKIAARMTNLRYEGSGTAVDLPGIVVSDTTTNDTTLKQKSVFKHTTSTLTSFTWSVKVGINVGISISVTVGVPPIASSTTKISANFSFDSKVSKTVSEKETWEIDREVLVPRHTRMDMTWTISEKESTATFYSDIVITGYIAIWNKDKIDVNDPGGNDKHNLWFIRIEEAFRDMLKWGIAVPSMYTIGSSSITFAASGECTGSSGFNTTFDMKQTPLTSTDSESGPPRVITQVGIPADD